MCKPPSPLATRRTALAPRGQWRRRLARGPRRGQRKAGACSCASLRRHTRKGLLALEMRLAGRLTLHVGLAVACCLLSSSLLVLCSAAGLGAGRGHGKGGHKEDDEKSVVSTASSRRGSTSSRKSERIEVVLDESQYLFYNRQAIWDLEAYWLARGEYAPPPGSKKEVTRSRTSVLPPSTIDTGRELENSHAPLYMIDQETLEEVANMLICASSVPLINGEEGRNSVRELIPKLLFFHRDEAKEALFFGYGFQINNAREPHDVFLRYLYSLADRFFPKVVELVRKDPSFTVYHVGYGSGGVVAQLIAARMLSSSDLPYRTIDRRNERHQIKAITFNTLPTYTLRVAKDPLGPDNHMSFVTKDRFNQALPRWNDGQSRAAPGRFFQYLYFAQPPVELPYFDRSADLKTLTDEQPLTFMAFDPTREGTMNVDRRKKAVEDAFSQIVGFATSVVMPVEEGKETLLYEKITWPRFLLEVNSCLRQLESLLGAVLRAESKGYAISCMASSTDLEKYPADRVHSVICYIRSQNGKQYPIAEYSARRTTFEEFEEHAALPAARSDEYGRARMTKWSTCMAKLAQTTESLALITSHPGPHALPTLGTSLSSLGGAGELLARPREASIKPNVQFIPVDFSEPWHMSRLGYTFTSMPSSDSLLENIYKADRPLFYSLINMKVPFLKRCKDVLSPIPLAAGRGLDWARSNLAWINGCFTEMARSEKVKVSRGLPILFTKHSTKGYTTLDFATNLGSSEGENSSNSRDAIEPSRMSPATSREAIPLRVDEGTVAKLISCTGNTAAPIYDCTLEANQWIPKACPKMCASIRPGDAALSLCQSVLYCEEINSHVAFEATYGYRFLSHSFSTVRDCILAACRLLPGEKYSLHRFAGLGFEVTVAVIFGTTSQTA